MFQTSTTKLDPLVIGFWGLIISPFKPLVACLFFCTLTACGTIYNQIDQYEKEQPVNPYGGTTLFIDGVLDCKGVGCGLGLIILPFAIIDIPLSLAGDSIALPSSLLGNEYYERKQVCLGGVYPVPGYECNFASLTLKGQNKAMLNFLPNAPYLKYRMEKQSLEHEGEWYTRNDEIVINGRHPSYLMVFTIEDTSNGIRFQENQIGGIENISCTKETLLRQQID